VQKITKILQVSFQVFSGCALGPEKKNIKKNMQSCMIFYSTGFFLQLFGGPPKKHPCAQTCHQSCRKNPENNYESLGLGSKIQAGEELAMDISEPMLFKGKAKENETGQDS